MAILMPSPRASSRSVWRRLLPALGFLFVVACANFVPLQGWDPKAGPVVPHDSFPADCSLCHTGSDWRTLRKDFAFDHEKQTGVALRGAHAQAGCLMCHNDRGPVEQFAARGCGGCHADVHLGRLGANCQDCHEERTWVAREAIARHDRTRFPLVGAHAAAACFRCHPGAQVGNFAGAYVECAQCHADDRARAVPSHVAPGSLFGSTDCGQCHVPTAWQSARFDHPASFPLTRGHAGRACVECHQGGVYVGLSTACASCHQDDYNATTAPNHVAAGFSTDCAQCHTTARWGGARFDHPAFPIASGAHGGLGCATCHTTPGNFQAFSCIACHAHNQAEMANEHDEVGGYVWASANCYGCHPNGRK